jgi:hypothetical protein
MVRAVVGEVLVQRCQRGEALLPTLGVLSRILDTDLDRIRQNVANHIREIRDRPTSFHGHPQVGISHVARVCLELVKRARHVSQLAPTANGDFARAGGPSGRCFNQRHGFRLLLLAKIELK